MKNETATGPEFTNDSPQATADQHTRTDRSEDGHGCARHTRSIIAAVERHQMIELFNVAQPIHPPDKLVHELFEQQVKRTPDAVAVLYEGQSLTYAELNYRANRLACYLRGRGLGADQVGGICAERCLEMVVGILAILKAGAAYLPLDPNYPAERLRYMLEDAAPRVVLTQRKLQAALSATGAELILLDTQWNEISGDAPENLLSAELGLSSQNLVYVIYTSGSTGRPKGAAMTHCSMVNLIEWHRNSFLDNEGKRVLQLAALSFDVSFQELFSTLCTGGTVALPHEAIRRDPRALMELLCKHLIQRVFITPTMMQTLVESFKHTGIVPDRLEDVITAGEQLRISSEMESFFKHITGCRLHNHYGPTESHVVSTLTMEGNPDDWSTLPTIGRPISNAQMYILNGQLHPVPVGVTGEIFIGGAGLARGYLNRPELTAQRFLANPISADPSARMYRTGDLGRWRADGTLECLGRNDDQVKIRGYRIELSEIEAQLAGQVDVKEAVVVVREVVPGDKRLVAYVTQRGQSALTAAALRAHLQSVLPEYMVPGLFVVLENLPLTPSGKLDRRALPKPELQTHASQRYEPAQGKVEEALAGIWQELLQVERVSRQDNFFEIGGDSLIAMKLIMNVAEKLGIQFHVQEVFRDASFQKMAQTLEKLLSDKQARPKPGQVGYEEGLI